MSTRLAELRARRVLAEAGLDPDAPLRRLESATNEVWSTGEVIIRVNRGLHPRLRREADVAAILPPEVPYPEVLATGGKPGEAWNVARKVPGVPLVRCWPGLTGTERRRAVGQLADILRVLHRTEVPLDLRPIEDPLQPLGQGPMATDPLLAVLEQISELANVDVGLVAEAATFVRERRSALDPFDVTTLVHGDLHFQNVLWDGERVTALLDLEYARAAPPDLDLDVFLRFCAYPVLFVPPGREAEAVPLDYVEVPGWLQEDDPELFAHPALLDRLRIYALGFLAKELLLAPPRGPVANYTPSHPYRRFQRMVRATSYLDR